MSRATVVGGGLAGCEAAWQLARRGIRVTLLEMRPRKLTPAHRTGLLAELVCSNSFKSTSLRNASGLLKKELTILGSLLLDVASRCGVPAGKALAVDRSLFASEVERAIRDHPAIEVRREEVRELDPSEYQVLAAGPLMSKPLEESVARLLGRDSLYFYDAIAPIVDAESIDRSYTFTGSRYGVDADSYVNCVLTHEEYTAFVRGIRGAETVPLREFEEASHFEGCLPIEELAARGERTLAFGPLRPVGFGSKNRPYAVLQLRPENKAGTMYSLVGCQTRMRYREQKRVFGMVPALRSARFLRWGSMHRNTYLDAPAVLEPTLQLRGFERIFVGGQLTGSEGYVEAIGTGWLAGYNLARRILGRPPRTLPVRTAMGSLLEYLTCTTGKIQPMNVNYGLLGVRRRGPKREELAERAIQELEKWLESDC